MLRRGAAGAVLAIALAGCSLPWGGPDPEPAVEDAVAQLSAGKPGDAFGPGAEDLWDEVTEGLDATPTVKSVEVAENDGRATATLEWDWPIAGQHWTYTSELALARDGDTWRAELTRQAIHPELGEAATLARTTLKATRGRILGAGGDVLVEPRPVLRIGVDKSLLEAGDDVRAIAGDLARRVGVDVQPYVRQTQAAGPRAFVQAIVLRRNDPLARELTTREIHGVRVLADHLPLTPSRDFAPGLIGSVGPATAELIEKSNGRLRAGDDTGLSGLQARYDEQLGGVSGAKVVSVEGEERRELFSAPATDGTDLAITLDLELQQRAVAALAGIEPDSALVAIRPSTGEILAAASGPGAGGINTATFGKAAPGSTFKIVSALGLLRSGLAPDSRVDCPPTTSVNGKSFKNYSDYPSGSLGRITLAEAVAQSCNTAFIGNHAKLTPAVERDAAAALGFGVDHDVGFPAYFGSIPEPETETEAAADLIGQGKVQASAMSMATVIASVVAGKAVLPSLVPSVEVTQQQPASPLTMTEARQLSSMLAGVVDHGSGRGLQGVADLAKTGTAEFGTDGKTHAWMVAAKGDLAVAAYVEKGESGSQTAGPVLRQFLSRG